MARLGGIHPGHGAVTAAHVALQLRDGRRFRPSYDIQRDWLMHVAAKAFEFKIEVTSVEGVAEGRGGLGRSLKVEHALVPGLAGQPISMLSRLGCPLGRRPERAAIDRLSRLCTHVERMRLGA